MFKHLCLNARFGAKGDEKKMRFLQSKQFAWFIAFSVSVAFLLRVFHPGEISEGKVVTTEQSPQDADSLNQEIVQEGLEIGGKLAIDCATKTNELVQKAREEEQKKCEDDHLNDRVDALINPAFGGMGVRPMMCPSAVQSDTIFLSHGAPVLPIQLERLVEETLVNHMAFEPLSFESAGGIKLEPTSEAGGDVWYGDEFIGFYENLDPCECGGWGGLIP